MAGKDKGDMVKPTSHGTAEEDGHGVGMAVTSAGQGKGILQRQYTRKLVITWREGEEASVREYPQQLCREGVH